MPEKTKFDNGGPAFARALGAVGTEWENAQDGMTLLDWFAGQALCGEIASASTKASCDATADAMFADGETDVSRHLAKIAYRCAAAMIAEKRRRESAP